MLSVIFYFIWQSSFCWELSHVMLYGHIFGKCWISFYLICKLPLIIWMMSNCQASIFYLIRQAIRRRTLQKQPACQWSRSCQRMLGIKHVETACSLGTSGWSWLRWWSPSSPNLLWRLVLHWGDRSDLYPGVFLAERWVCGVFVWVSLQRPCIFQGEVSSNKFPPCRRNWPKRSQTKTPWGYRHVWNFMRAGRNGDWMLGEPHTALKRSRWPSRLRSGPYLPTEDYTNNLLKSWGRRSKNVGSRPREKKRRW